jgi:hypothetical protein
MAKKTQVAAVEAVPEIVALPVDVCGQPGGPSPEEQEQVDAEQRELMALRKAEWEAEKEAERAAGTDVQSKMERAAARSQAVMALPEKVAELEKLVAELAAKVGK